MDGEQATPRRDPSLDIARGLIVALMALDHVRMYFSAAQFDPMDLDRTTFGWFAVRWVTHLCAPGFFFIAGLGAALMERRAGRAAIARFLLLRGAWLILLEIALFGIAWSFNPGWLWLGVIWGLGAAMILLAALVFLPRWVLLTAAGAFILLHNAFWSAGMLPGTMEAIIYAGGVAELPLLGPRFVLYPVLPWAALMVLGYASAGWTMRDGRPAARLLAVAGLTMVAAFAVLRLAGFGQPAAAQDGAGGASVLAFLDVQKYPPSLQFSLVTLGLMALFLAAIARAEARPRWLGAMRPLLAYGRVPFFFYLLHIFLIHGAALAIATLIGWPTAYLFWDGMFPNLRPPDGYGFGLGGVVLAWLAVLFLLYPLCAWFAEVKRRHPDSVLRLL